LAESTIASLGMTQPDRNAQEIAKDRALRRAVRHGLRYDLMTAEARNGRQGRRVIKRMKWAMMAAEIGTDRLRTHRLALQLLGARSALTLIELELPNLWEAVRAELLEGGWIAAGVDAEYRERPSASRTHADCATPASGPANSPRQRGRGAATSVSVLLEGLGFTEQGSWSRAEGGYSVDAANAPGRHASSAYPTTPGYGVPASETFVSAADGVHSASPIAPHSTVAADFGAESNNAPIQWPAMAGRSLLQGAGTPYIRTSERGSDTGFEGPGFQRPAESVGPSAFRIHTDADTTSAMGPDTSETNDSSETNDLAEDVLPCVNGRWAVPTGGQEHSHAGGHLTSPVDTVVPPVDGVSPRGDSR